MVYERIKSLCKEKRYNIHQLEKAVGLGNGTIAGWQKYSPNVDNLKKVADFFEVPVDFFIA
mgnify:CR=1 FL=1